MAMTRGRARVFYADGTTDVVQTVYADRVQARNEVKQDHVDVGDATAYMAWLAAKREGKTTADWDAFTLAIADVSELFTSEQLDEAFAAGNIDADQYAIALNLVSATDAEGESTATRSLSPASPSSVDSPSAASATS